MSDVRCIKVFTILSRIIHYGVQNFRRNGLLSAATVAIMVIALVVFAGLLLFNYSARQVAAFVEDKIDIRIYFFTNTPEDQILAVRQSLESLPEVQSVEYISRDRALEIFRDKHRDKPEISQAINELDSNPLEASLNIKAKRPDQYASIASYIESPNIRNHVDSISYSENQEAIENLTAIVNRINWGGLVAAMVMAAIAGLVVFNTIRIAIHSNREELSVMRLVGASNSLVRGPLMVEGAISGILSSILSLIIVFPAVYFASPHLEVPGLNLFHYFYTHLPQLFFYQLLFGVGIGVLSSSFAVRKYLRN